MLDAVYKVAVVAILALILSGITELIHTVYDKGINVNMHQRVSTNHLTFDVKAIPGTTINMHAPISMPNNVQGDK